MIRKRLLFGPRNPFRVGDCGSVTDGARRKIISDISARAAMASTQIVRTNCNLL
jgi:hypothetical protein